MEGTSPPPSWRSTALKPRPGRPSLPSARDQTLTLSTSAGFKPSRRCDDQDSLGAIKAAPLSPLPSSGREASCPGSPGSGPQRRRGFRCATAAALPHPRHSHRQPDLVPCNRRHWPYKMRAGPFSISVSFLQPFLPFAGHSS